jgi:hypothetical protein
MKAFPIFSYVNANGETHDVQHQGMDLRDYFAAKALTGLLTEANMNYNDDAIAELAWGLADAMIKARK